MKVLLIESDKATQETLIDLLELQWPHMNITAVDNGVDGIALAKQQKVNLILLEGSRHAYNGLNGFDTAQALRKLPQTKYVPIIAITSPMLGGNDMTTTLSKTCNAWLLKPFSAQRLYQVVSPFALEAV